MGLFLDSQFYSFSCSSSLKRCPRPNPWNLGICSVTRQRGVKAAEGVRVALGVDLEIGRGSCALRSKDGEGSERWRGN